MKSSSNLLPPPWNIALTTKNNDGLWGCLDQINSRINEKNLGKPFQGDINTLESELVAKAAKVKSTEGMIEKRQKYGFSVVVLGMTKHGTVTGNFTVQWTLLDNPRVILKESIKKISFLIKAKVRKSIPEKFIGYKKFFGMEKSMQALIFQAVKEPYL